MEYVITLLVILSAMWLVYYVFAMWKIQSTLKALGRPQHWDFRGIAITAVSVAILLTVMIV